MSRTLARFLHTRTSVSFSCCTSASLSCVPATDLDIGTPWGHLEKIKKFGRSTRLCLPTPRRLLRGRVGEPGMVLAIARCGPGGWHRSCMAGRPGGWHRICLLRNVATGTGLAVAQDLLSTVARGGHGRPIGRVRLGRDCLPLRPASAAKCHFAVFRALQCRFLPLF